MYRLISAICFIFSSASALSLPNKPIIREPTAPLKNIDLFDFISGHNSVIDYGKEEIASIEVARLMAGFHNEIAKTGYSGHDLEVFLIRILFCLFAFSI